MLGPRAPLICIIRRGLIPLQLIIVSNGCTSFPHCRAQPSGFPVLGRQGSNEPGWPGAGNHPFTASGCVGPEGPGVGLSLESCRHEIQNSGKKDKTHTSMLWSLLIRNAFETIRVFEQFALKNVPLGETEYKQVCGLIVNYFE